MSHGVTTKARCAIYTRKSSEEGLDQAFNSLDAQREAGIDYIKSQKSQGWVLVESQYDDGGYSGGSMERPGLKALLDDIAKGRIDIVLVYKVDRLSRSLSDFARLMQLFDERHVSFVSVTQQFNTTTSMGRLTLNMLLSFAQFEREVAGERIRDKIAATKRKGIWVSGRPPIGYRLPREGDEGFAAGDRTLRVIDDEANVVRLIFGEYLALGSALKVTQKLNTDGVTYRGGRDRNGQPTKFHSQIINRILNNPIYIGKLTHKRRTMASLPQPASPPEREVFDAAHKPIIDMGTWGKVRQRMATQAVDTQREWTHTHLLKGKVRTYEDYSMSSCWVGRRRHVAGKPAGGKGTGQPPRIIRYYTSQKGHRFGFAACKIKTINAEHLDNLVRAMVIGHLLRAESIDLVPRSPAERDHWIREVIHRVVIAPERISVELARERIPVCRAGLAECVDKAAAPADTVLPHCPYAVQVDEQERHTMLSLNIQIKRHDGRRLLLSPDGNDLLTSVKADGTGVPRQHLVRAIGLAYAWRQQLINTGGTIRELAMREGYTDSRVHRLLTLTQLSPAIIKDVLMGRLTGRASLDDLLTAAEHLNWGIQSHAIGP